MQKAIELMVRGQTLRGMEHVPESRTEGALPAVILFHGFTATKVQEHRFFVKISRALEKIGIASFRFDFMGSGESDGNFEDMTLQTELEDGEAILNFVQQDPRIDPARVSLLGLSMGGLVASLLAGKRDKDVNRLILLAPAGNLDQIIAYSMQMYGVHERMEVFDHAGNLIGRGFADSLANLNAFERAKAYAGPVLLIHGTKDETVPYQVSLKYHELAYGGRAVLQMVEGADHTFNSTPWEQSVISAIEDFTKADAES